MIARGMEIVDIEPAGYGNFLALLEKLSPSRPRAVLWHEQGIVRLLTLDDEVVQFGVRSVRDARESARQLYSMLRGKAKQVVVTDRQSYFRMSDTLNLGPLAAEEKYGYRGRLNQELRSLAGESFAIYPQPTLDRGPLEYTRVSSFFSSHGAGSFHVVLGVFDRGELYFSFVVRLRGALAEWVSSFDHWPAMTEEVEFSAESLETVVRRVEQSLGTVACALFLARSDMERLFDGQRHDSLPVSLIAGSRAFGISNLPGVAELAFLNTAGLFAYAPVFVQ